MDPTDAGTAAEPTPLEPEALEPSAVEIHAMSLDNAREARRWIRTLTPLLQACDRDGTSERSDAVRAACDATVVCLLARVRRMLRQDLGDIGPDEGRAR
jgi:hypothetical protein